MPPTDKAPIPVTAIWLRRIGPDVEVFVEVAGDFYKAITELHNGYFSAIVESRGISEWPIYRETADAD